MAKNNPKLPDYETLLAMFGYIDGCESPMKAYLQKVLRVNDQQIAINKYKWFNLPPEIDPQLLERILYYRGQGMLFFIPEIGKFYFLPYALDGTIDVYGRFTSVKPLPFIGKDNTDDEDNKK